MPSATLVIVSVEKQEKSYRITAKGSTGDWTFRAKHEIGQGLSAGMTVGIQYSISEFTGRDGAAKCKWIDSWVEPASALERAQPVGQVGSHNGADPAKVRAFSNRPRTTTEAENIFVTGIVGRSMGSGQFRVDQISELTVAARRAWRGEGSVAGLKEEEFE